MNGYMHKSEGENKMIRNDLIYVNVITRHTGHWAMFNAFQGAAGYASQHGYKCMLAPHVGDSLVSRARNNSMSDFLDSDAGWFFTLDDDVAIPHNTLVDLITANKDMIGGIYRLKKEVDLNNPAVSGVAMRGKEGFVFGQTEPAEVYYISGGCVMYKRSFIEEMVKHYPELEYVENLTKKPRYGLYIPYIYNGEYLSEDWAFCQRALDKGYKLYILPNVLCDHWGLRNYTFEELLKEK